MARCFKGPHGFQGFAYEIIHIISMGRTESINDILDEMDRSSLTKYINDKYSEDLSFPLDDTCMYDLESWDNYFCVYAQNTSVNRIERDLGITGDDNGLLVLLAAVISKMKAEPEF